MSPFGRHTVPLFVLIGSACLLGACGGSSTASTATPHAASTPASSPTPAPSPPPGGPAPAELIGTWHQMPGPTVIPVDLTILANRYGLDSSVESATGEIVVNGTEIDFFNGDGCTDHPLPDGVGRYQWSIQGSTLHFTPINQDPCGRAGHLNNTSYTKTSG